MYLNKSIRVILIIIYNAIINELSAVTTIFISANIFQRLRKLSLLDLKIPN